MYVEASRLSGRVRLLCAWLGVAATCSLVAQLVMGASPLIVMLVFLCCGFALWSFAAIGPYNLGSWLCFFYLLGNVLVALYAKTLLGQPLQSHMHSPVDAYAAVTVGTLAAVVALWIATYVKVGRPLFSAVLDIHYLSYLSWSCLILGGLFWSLNRMFQDSDGSGFGGITLFRNLLLMAVIARTAFLLESSDDDRSFDWKLGVVLGLSVAAGLVDDSKTGAALPVVSYFATVFFYRGRIRRTHVAALLLGGALFVAFIAPMLHAYRALGVQQMSVGQRVELIGAGLNNVIHRGAFGHYSSLADQQFAGGYYNYFGGGTGQMLLGRYASVQQIDPVVDRINQKGALGGSVIWPAFTRLLPRFVDPDKPKYTNAFLITVRLGLQDWENGKFPTVPLAAQAYAGYGYWGLLIIPLATFLAFLLALKKLGWQLHRNVYAIFFFCDFIVVYANQGSLGQYAGSVLRSFPLLAFVFWLLLRIHAPLSSLRLRRRRFSKWQISR